MCVYVCVCHLYLYVLICGSDREQTVKLMCVPACLLKKQCNIPMGILFPRSSISLLLLFCSILRLISGGAMLSLRKSNVLDLFSAKNKKSGNLVSEDYSGGKKSVNCIRMSWVLILFMLSIATVSLGRARDFVSSDLPCTPSLSDRTFVCEINDRFSVPEFCHRICIVSLPSCHYC